jgi:hypothetical protein
MPLPHHHDFARRFYKGALFGAALLILLYGLFEGRRLLLGPQITITAPHSGEATSSAAVTIAGTASNISFLTINDKPAFTDEAGHFTLTLSPPLGYTVFTVVGVDRFGRTTKKQVSLMVLNYCPYNIT